MTAKPARPRIDAAAKARFIALLAEGERREDAAALVGFHMMSLYGARRRDPAFAAAWVAALAASAAAARAPRDADGADRAELRIAMANRRLYQRRRHRNVRFDAARQAEFLDHFLGCCDLKGAAAAVGVSESTVRLHRRKNPEFAEAYKAALQEGYVLLEAETVRVRLAAQARLRAAWEAAAARGRGARPAACPTCGHNPDDDKEFDRTMAVLARRDRKFRRVESNFKPGGLRHRMSFDEAIVLLEKKMRALGLWDGPPSSDGGGDKRD